MFGDFFSSTKKDKNKWEHSLAFKMSALGFNHWQRRNFTFPWEPIIWKRKHTKQTLVFRQ